MALDPQEWWRDMLTDEQRTAFMDNAGKSLTPELIDIATRTGAFPTDAHASDVQSGHAEMQLSQAYVGLIDREAARRSR